MKIFKRVPVLVGGMIYLNNLKTQAVPDYNKSVDIENLTDPVTGDHQS